MLHCHSLRSKRISSFQLDGLANHSQHFLGSRICEDSYNYWGNFRTCWAVISCPSLCNGVGVMFCVCWGVEGWTLVSICLSFARGLSSMFEACHIDIFYKNSPYQNSLWDQVVVILFRASDWGLRILDTSAFPMCCLAWKACEEPKAWQPAPNLSFFWLETCWTV